jgi:hypothetical protein
VIFRTSLKEVLFSKNPPSSAGLRAIVRTTVQLPVLLSELSTGLCYADMLAIFR